MQGPTSSTHVISIAYIKFSVLKLFLKQKRNKLDFIINFKRNNFKVFAIVSFQNIKKLKENIR